jgi:hypothetical protein
MEPTTVSSWALCRPLSALHQIDHEYDQPQYSFIVLSAATDMAAAIKRLQAGV